MGNGMVTLNDIHEDLTILKTKITHIASEVEEISHDLHRVRPSYEKKLEKIRKGKHHSFKTKEDFLKFLEHEL